MYLRNLLCMYIHVSICTCMYLHMQQGAYNRNVAPLRVCMYTYVYLYVYVYVHVYMNLQCAYIVLTCICLCMYMYCALYCAYIYPRKQKFGA